jgi:hypothetical protein
LRNKGLDLDSRSPSSSSAFSTFRDEQQQILAELEAQWQRRELEEDSRLRRLQADDADEDSYFAEDGEQIASLTLSAAVLSMTGGGQSTHEDSVGAEADAMYAHSSFAWSLFFLGFTNSLSIGLFSLYFCRFFLLTEVQRNVWRRATKHPESAGRTAARLPHHHPADLSHQSASSC